MVSSDLKCFHTTQTIPVVPFQCCGYLAYIYFDCTDMLLVSTDTMNANDNDEVTTTLELYCLVKMVEIVDLCLNQIILFIDEWVLK